MILRIPGGTPFAGFLLSYRPLFSWPRQPMKRKARPCTCTLHAASRRQSNTSNTGTSNLLAKSRVLQVQNEVEETCRVQFGALLHGGRGSVCG